MAAPGASRTSDCKGIAGGLDGRKPRRGRRSRAGAAAGVQSGGAKAPPTAPPAPPAAPSSGNDGDAGDDALSWDEALRRYEDHLQARRAAHRTIYAHGRVLAKLRAALACEAARPGEVTLDQLRRYQLGLQRRRLSAATVANETGHVRSFFRFLFLDELVAHDPSARLERPRVPPRLPGEVLTPGEAQAVLAACAQAKPPLLARAVVEVLYCTGVRRSELLALEVFDLNHRQRTLLVRAGKGEKPRVLPVAPSCYEALARYLDYGRPELEREPTPALFLSQLGHPLSRDTLARLLTELGERAGLGKQLTPHVFRRSCATGLLSNGTNLKVIQAVLGHSSLETTSVYLSLSPEEIRSAVLERHPRERFEA